MCGVCFLQCVNKKDKTFTVVWGGVGWVAVTVCVAVRKKRKEEAHYCGSDLTKRE